MIKTIIALDKRFSNFKVGIMSGGLDTPKHETQMLIGGLDILVSTPDRLTRMYSLRWLLMTLGQLTVALV